MAIATGQDAIDQIISPLNEIGLRRLRICRSDRNGSNHGHQQSHPNCHDVPHSCRHLPCAPIEFDHNCRIECGKQKGRHARRP
jgi:hypothetical protein